MAEFAYIGVNKFGSVRAFVMDDPGCEKETATLVAEWIEMGRTIERIPADELQSRMNPKPSEVVVRELRNEWER
jgi:hypothetical protein